MNWSQIPIKSSLIKLDSSNRLHQLSIPIVGLTGGLASGKSTAAKIIENLGAAHIDADQLVKTAYKREDSKEFVKSISGQAIKESGDINFSVLRKLVFENPQIKLNIEQFIYKKLPALFIEKLSTFDSPKWVLYNVPLLFEKHLNNLVDVSICVFSPPETQEKRALARDKSQRSTIKSILSSQMSIEEKRKVSQFTIDNSGKKSDLSHQVQEAFKLILEF